MATHSNPAFVLVNPKARNGTLGQKWPDHEKEVLDALGDSSATVEFTTKKENGSGLVRKALQSGAKRIVVVGGDGTLSNAIQGFFENNRPIAPDSVLMVMPAGKGDDFFKSVANQRFYSGSSAWLYGLDIIRSGKPQPIDLGLIRWKNSPELPSRYFINIVGFGFAGLVVQQVQKREGFLAKTIIGQSAWAYAVQAVNSFFKYHPFDLKIVLDDQPFFEGEVFQGMILNGRYSAGGISWNPDCRINDGCFHVQVMKPKAVTTQVKDSIKSLFRSWKQIHDVKNKTAKKVEVLIRHPRRKPHPLFEIDGEILESADTQGAIVEILPGAIQLQTL